MFLHYSDATDQSRTSGEQSPFPVGSGELAAVNATIADGQALSAAVDLEIHRLHRIGFPAGFVSADVTFQVSDDGVTFYDLYTAEGEYSLPAAAVAASRSVLVDALAFLGVRHLKVRNGTGAAAVNVTGDQDLVLSLIPR